MTDDPKPALDLDALQALFEAASPGLQNNGTALIAEVRRLRANESALLATIDRLSARAEAAEEGLAHERAQHAMTMTCLRHLHACLVSIRSIASNPATGGAWRMSDIANQGIDDFASLEARRLAGGGT